MLSDGCMMLSDGCCRCEQSLLLLQWQSLSAPKRRTWQQPPAYPVAAISRAAAAYHLCHATGCQPDPSQCALLPSALLLPPPPLPPAQATSQPRETATAVSAAAAAATKASSGRRSRNTHFSVLASEPCHVDPV